MAITPLPTPPSRSDPANFAVRADEFLGALPLFQTEANALQTDVNAKQVTATNAANTATAAANAASAATGVTVWVSGTTYAVGDNRFSPLNFLTYRRKTAGAGTTDPSLDATNWAQISGTGNVSVDGSGRLGLGTGAPSSLLTILSTDPTAANFIRNVNVASSGTAGAQIEFGALVGSTPTVASRIAGILAASGTQGLLTFSTLNGSSLIERMRIDDAGRVAIGTTSPTLLFEVANVGSNAQMGLKAANNGFSELYFADTDGLPGAIVYSHSSNSMSFFVNSVSRMTIDQAGSLFIGSAAVSSKTYLNSAISDMCSFNSQNAVGPYLTLGRNGVPFGYIGAAAALITGGSPADLTIRSDANITFGISSNERMRIDSAGNLIVGSTTNGGIGGGTDKLAVNGSLGIIRQINASPGSGTSLELVNRSTGGMDFYVNAGTVLALQIASGGNVSFSGTSTYQGNEIGWRNKRVVTASSNSDLVLGFTNNIFSSGVTSLALTTRTAGSTFDIINTTGNTIALSGTGGVTINHVLGTGTRSIASGAYITVTYLSATVVFIRGSGIT